MSEGPGTIGPDDLVLDVGGWARCFNRANHVTTSSRSSGTAALSGDARSGPQGGPVEHFTAETWVARDICDHTPWPYADKAFDFCVCSHTLEDIRDPLWSAAR